MSKKCVLKKQAPQNIGFCGARSSFSFGICECPSDWPMCSRSLRDFRLATQSQVVAADWLDTGSYSQFSYQGTARWMDSPWTWRAQMSLPAAYSDRICCCRRCCSQSPPLWGPSPRCWPHVSLIAWTLAVGGACPIRLVTILVTSGVDFCRPPCSLGTM